MTLDVTIGKIVVGLPDFDYIEKYGPDTDIIQPYIWVATMPEADADVCDSELTAWPRESYRSGSTSFWRFFRMSSLHEIYNIMRRNPGTNDRDVACIKPLLDRIMAIDEADFREEVDLDRLKWFKYWCKRAVEEYGEYAGVMFT